MTNVFQFSTVITLMVQFLCTFGYDNTFSSCICVSILIGTGIAVSLVVSLLVQDTRKVFIDRLPHEQFVVHKNL